MPSRRPGRSSLRSLGRPDRGGDVRDRADPPYRLPDLDDRRRLGASLHLDRPGAGDDPERRARPLGELACVRGLPRSRHHRRHRRERDTERGDARRHHRRGAGRRRVDLRRRDREQALQSEAAPAACGRDRREVLRHGVDRGARRGLQLDRRGALAHLAPRVCDDGASEREGHGQGRGGRRVRPSSSPLPATPSPPGSPRSRGVCPSISSAASGARRPSPRSSACSCSAPSPSRSPHRAAPG